METLWTFRIQVDVGRVIGILGRLRSYRCQGVFEKPPELRKRRTRRIDARYYGYRDDEDGILEKLEGPAEKRMRAAALEDWMEMEKIKKEAQRAVKSGEVAEVGNVSNILFEEEEDVVEEERMKVKEREEKEKENEFVAHVPLPDEEEIKRMVLEKKKQDMLDKYTSNELRQELTEANTLLNIQR